MIAVGRPAPAFAVEDQDGRVVSLDSLSGRYVVLYFYPKDDTPGCTIEACEFTAGLPSFSAQNAVVYGVSPDSPESHRKFIAKHGLSVGLLSDPGLATLKAYDAYGDKTLYGKKTTGVLRSTVVIDPNGVVVARFTNVKAQGHAEEVREKLAALQGGAKASEAPSRVAPRSKKRRKAAKKKAQTKGVAKKSTAKKAAPKKKSAKKAAAKKAAPKKAKKAPRKKAAAKKPAGSKAKAAVARRKKTARRR
jgi:thioredoxin-dependent peroxiredoxin